MTEITTAYVGIADVAKYFGVSVLTIRNWYRKKIIPPDTYIKTGNAYRFRLADVDAAIRSRTAQAGITLVPEAPEVKQEVPEEVPEEVPNELDADL